MKIYAAFFSFLVTAMPALVHADIAPPPGYVEQCTLARQSGEGRECRECSTYFGNPPNHCATQVGDGFTQACRTSGASTWTEVWCKAGTTAPTQAATPTTNTSTTTESSSEDCSLAGGTQSSSTAILFGLVAMMITRRRR